jgi:hypothetical protein
MSWKEAEEAFKRSDTVIMPVGTFHGHGPTPISIDTSSVEYLADEMGKRTGLVTLPVVPFGENEKQKHYPGSIAINEEVFEQYCFEIYKSLRRNGARKVLVLNGHGGNHESLIRAGRKAREFGMVTAIVEWYATARTTFEKEFSDILPKAVPGGGRSYIAELGVALVLGGKDIADLRGAPGYKGEWGSPYTVRQIFGQRLKTLSFNDFEFQGGPVIIPMEAWDIDLEGPPIMGKEVVDNLYERSKVLLERLVDYLVALAAEFEKVNVTEALKSKDSF